VTPQGSAYHRFRRALDRGNVTEALSVAFELEHVGLSEALELCLLLRDKAPERYPRAALRWHGRLCREVDVSLEEAQATLAALVRRICSAGEGSSVLARHLSRGLARRRVAATTTEGRVRWRTAKAEGGTHARSRH
jgi:hypothetical protein